MIYFDNGSTSFPKAPGVTDAMADYINNGAFNINRGNYEGAYDIEEMVLETRELLLDFFKAPKETHVVFTPGITYSLNYFIKGFLKKGDHVLISGMEHNAVVRPLVQLEKEGIRWEIINTRKNGIISLEDLRKKITLDTKAVIINHASNVCGAVQPISEIGRICREKGIVLAIDTAQSAGTIAIDMESDFVDFLAFTGHKGLLGPQGIGGFIVTKSLAEKIVPLIVGGTGSMSDKLIVPEFLPDRFESGTLNLPGIIGLRTAILHINDVGIKGIYQKKMELTDYFFNEVKNFKEIKIIGDFKANDRAAVVSLDFLGRDNAMVAFDLEQDYGIMTRVGLHCAPIAHKTLGTFPKGTVRFSFSKNNTIEEIDRCIKAFYEMEIK